MKALIVYFSKFGNTRKVAHTIAETMKQAGDARVVGIDQLAAADLEGVDLVVMGSPTHGLTIPPAVRSALAPLPPGILAGKSVAAFDTTVTVWPLRHFRASPKLLRRLRQLGGKPVVPPQTFSVLMRNPPGASATDLLLEGEIERARAWANEILRQLKT